MTIDNKSIALIVIIVLSATASFGLGRLSVAEEYRDTSSATVIIPELPELKSNDTNYAFVASKSGTKYYPKGCKGINRIKPENRVYFETRDEAEGSGLTPASSC